jgi:hypothetical protein
VLPFMMSGVVEEWVRQWRHTAIGGLLASRLTNLVGHNS